MDASVLAALAKWPNVPACYGWLELDARGQWRLGAADSVQREIVRHAGLANFLGRNYSCTESGEWFCQNGPQRAYVSLAVTPWIVRMSNDQLSTHTGLLISSPNVTFVDETGRFFVDTEYGLGIIDDRDLSAFVNRLVCRIDQAKCTDEVLEALIRGQPHGIAFKYQDRCIDLHAVDSSTLEGRFGFVRNPLIPSVPQV